MRNTEHLTVTLLAETADLLRHSVEDGEYPSASDIVREALEDWANRREQQHSKLQDLRAAIEQGLHSGAAIPADELFAEMKRRYAAAE